MKKIIIFAVIVLFIAGIYVLVTLKSGTTLNEPSPLEIISDTSLNSSDNSEIKDSFDTMDEETRAEFEKAVMEMADKVMEVEESIPSEALLVAEGEFMPRVHGVEGSALLIEENGTHIVRFEDFETDNGPQLFIYLSSDLGNDDFINLGEIKATKGNINYEIPKGTDITKYNNVLVWCRPFGVLFSYAKLK
jgi:hypothetical protein